VKIGSHPRFFAILKWGGVPLGLLALILAGIVLRYWLIYPRRWDEATNPKIIFSDLTVDGQPLRMQFDTGWGGGVTVTKTITTTTNNATTTKTTTKLETDTLGSGVLTYLGAVKFGLKVSYPPKTSSFSANTDGLPDRALQVKAGPHTFLLNLLVQAPGKNPPAWEPRSDGVIGWPFLRNNILVFDSNGHTVRGVEQLPPVTAGWLKLKLVEAPILILETPLPDGKPGAILVDTGNPFGVSLPPAQYNEWRAKHPAAPSSGNVETAIAFEPLLPTEFAWADEIKLGAFTLTDVPVRAATHYETEVMNRPSGLEYVGSLGLYALARMNLVVDGKGGFAYMQPKPPPGPPFEIIDRPGVLDDLFTHPGNWDWSATASGLNFDTNPMDSK